MVNDIEIKSADEMIAFGKVLIQKGSRFLLSGELGTGKTTLTKGIVSGLEIDPTIVQSPTYTYLHIYDEKLLHIDMRRIESAEQLHTLGILELIEQYPYVVIERPKWKELYHNENTLEIHLESVGTGRKITIF